VAEEKETTEVPGLLLRTADKDKFLEDLRTQTLRFLKAEKYRLQVEREFLLKSKEGLKDADSKNKRLSEVQVYADVAKLLGIKMPKQVEEK
tara:strand:+ start:89507 stop:89779 length:273 start_codon:yes stop_codon:yes gene_type:complete